MKEEYTGSGGITPRNTFQYTRSNVKSRLNSPLSSAKLHRIRRVFVSISLLSIFALFTFKQCFAFPVLPAHYLARYYQSYQGQSHHDLLSPSWKDASHIIKRDINQKSNQLHQDRINFAGFKIFGDGHYVSSEGVS